MTVQFLLYDLPSDHEVDLNIVTECDVIRSIISNRQQGKKVKVIRATQELPPTNKTNEVAYVHLSGHGNKQGLGLIGGSVKWVDVAEHILRAVQRLKGGRKRVLCVSCCHSKDAVDQMFPLLKGYFTRVYYFSDHKIGFAASMTVWSMFYSKQNLSRPLVLAPAINEFFSRNDNDDGPLMFRKVPPKSPRVPLRRNLRR